MTLSEPLNPPIADVELPDTEVIVVAHPSPVFVDSTGRRRRRLRRIAYGFGALCMVYGGLISVSLAGGPVSSSAVLPLPRLADGSDGEDIIVARPNATPEPTVTRTSAQPILEVFPRHGAPVTRTAEARSVARRPPSATPQPSRTPSAMPAKPSPSPTPRPVESTTKPTTPDTTPDTTPTTTPPVPPAPPAPPAGSDTSGGGGGGAVDAPADPPPTRAPADDPADSDPKPTVPVIAKPEPTAAPEPEPTAAPEPEPSGEAAA